MSELADVKIEPVTESTPKQPTEVESFSSGYKAGQLDALALVPVRDEKFEIFDSLIMTTLTVILGLTVLMYYDRFVSR